MQPTGEQIRKWTEGANKGATKGTKKETNKGTNQEKTGEQTRGQARKSSNTKSKQGSKTNKPEWIGETAYSSVWESVVSFYHYFGPTPWSWMSVLIFLHPLTL